MSESSAPISPDVPAEAWSGVHRGPLREGEWVRLIDQKGRKHNFELTPGKRFFSNKGHLDHDEMIGRDEGFTVTSSAGGQYLVFRPLLSEFVVSMPRGAAVVYPKDAAQIVALADIYPGARVVEAGAGSGALTCSLLRAVGPWGKVTSFELREEFAEVAKRNVDQFFNAPAGSSHPARGAEAGRPQGGAAPAGGPSRPDHPRHARPVELCRHGRREAGSGRHRLRLHRHHHPAVPRRGDAARARWVHRAAPVGVDGPRLARRGPRRTPRPQDDRPHRLPRSPRAAWHRGRRRCARPAGPRRVPTASTTPARDRPTCRRWRPRSRPRCNAGVVASEVEA
ncbi:tRNA (adenine-N1)-methyltransferase [Nocardioides sp. B-3]|uniref:tRNA (adenine-N1)-methyltransferase n=1 Tax=Nocardioides sp. B-3 TaxID=2895565 RepID=UPI003FA53A55